jgi:hypothetical protein
VEHGVVVAKNLRLEDLASDDVSEFLCVVAHPELCGTPSLARKKISAPNVTNEDLARHTTPLGAFAADEFTLDNGNGKSTVGTASGHVLAGRSSIDHYNIVGRHMN